LSRRCSRAACLLALGLALVAPAAARAAVVMPWAPVGPDSIGPLVAEAKMRFRQVDSDTVTEQTAIPFEKVGLAARRLLRRLGRDHTLLAPSIGPSLDSLGLDVDVVNDPDLPAIVFVMVRNPYRLSMQAIGYLLWYRGQDLRMQGAVFPPGLRSRLRSWWTGSPASPYAAAVIYQARGQKTQYGFKYFRMNGDGAYWNLVQYEGHGPDLGTGGDVAFADLNHDGLPELVAWSSAPPDSVLSVLPPVQPLVREAIYTDRGEGFIVHDARIVPGPLATLHLFVNALREHNQEQARHLLVDPEFLALAVAAGWAHNRSPGNFVVDRQEEGRPWPTWLGARVRGASGFRRWVFHFVLRDGRWLIKDWLAEETPRAESAPGAAPDSTGGHRP